MAKNTDIQSLVLSPEVEEIRSRIYVVRGVPVMFDFDLARYYQIETRVLKQAVRRNMDSFPEDFMFEPTKEELNALILSMGSQFVTPKTKTPFGGYSPFAFTEAGVAMLSAVLKSSVAVETRVSVMRGFVSMHRYLTQNGQLLYRMDKLEAVQQEQAEQIKAVMSGVDTILTALEQRQEDPKPDPIGYDAIAQRREDEKKK